MLLSLLYLNMVQHKHGECPQLTDPKNKQEAILQNELHAHQDGCVAADHVHMCESLHMTVQTNCHNCWLNPSVLNKVGVQTY
jgi:hypothetical protein